MFSRSTLIFNSDLGSSLNLSFNSGRAANASVCTSGSKLVLYQQTEEEKGGKREDPRKDKLWTCKQWKQKTGTFALKVATSTFLNYGKHFPKSILQKSKLICQWSNNLETKILNNKVQMYRFCINNKNSKSIKIDTLVKYESKPD